MVGNERHEIVPRNNIHKTNFRNTSSARKLRPMAITIYLRQIWLLVALR